MGRYWGGGHKVGAEEVRRCERPFEFTARAAPQIAAGGTRTSLPLTPTIDNINARLAGPSFVVHRLQNIPKKPRISSTHPFSSKKNNEQLNYIIKICTFSESPSFNYWQNYIIPFLRKSPEVHKYQTRLGHDGCH